MHKQLLETQIAIFFKNPFTVLSDEEVFLKIRELFGEPEDKKYTNVPDGAPTEIPRILLSYNNFKLNFSKTRADIFTDKEFEEIEDIVNKFVKLFLNDFNIKIIRIGFVKNFFSEVGTDFLKMLLNKKVDNLNFKEISVRVNIEKNIDGIKCNNIQNISAGMVEKIDKGGEVVSGTIITRDINIADMNIMNENQVKKFIKEFNKESAQLIYDI